MWTWLSILDMIGTAAFAVAGAASAIRNKMDLFGVNALAVCSATGGGVIRDLLIGNTPPKMFQNPVYVIVALVTANLVFAVARFFHRTGGKSLVFYDRVLFLSDTLGLAAFTVDGALAGIRAGYGNNHFLVVFLGMMTGVGGGALASIFAGEIPSIFRKHVYALSSIAGGVVMEVVVLLTGRVEYGGISGFTAVLIIRCLAAYFRWNLPVVENQ